MRRLSSNHLGDDGTGAICKALSESKVSKLQELDLYNNFIGSTGAEALGSLLLVHASLTTVWTPAQESSPYLILLFVC